MPYLIARKGFKVECISYTVESAHDLIYNLLDQGCALEPSDVETYLNKGIMSENGSMELIQTASVNSNTWKITI